MTTRLSINMSFRLAGFLVAATLSGGAWAQSQPGKTEFTLKVQNLPQDLWNKARLVPSLEGNGLRLRDPQGGDFNDASLWQIDFDKPLPFGRKELSVNITVAPGHNPLWGTALLQPLINGKEANAALDENGNPSFTKVIGGDGKGFVPATSATLRFSLGRSKKTLGSFAFMTAGAKDYDIVLRDFKVTVWPENDDRVWPQRGYASHLPYHPNDQKTLMIEWHDDEESLKQQNAKVTVEGPSGRQVIETALPLHPSTASGSRVSPVDLSRLTVEGRYAITIPAFGARTSPGTVEVEVRAASDHLTRLRDQAWGVFYWITNDKNGPYPDAHKLDRAARTYGRSHIRRDVRGGWFDAGDYGKYSVNGAYSAALLLLTGLNAPQAVDHSIEPIAGRRAGYPDWLSVVDTQMDWLLKMQGPDGGVNHKATTRDWPGMDVKPNEDRAVKWLMPVSSTATADFAATMLLAAKAYARVGDSAKAIIFNEAARKAEAWLAANPGLKMIEQRYDGAQYGGPYDDTDDGDERFFAVAARAAQSLDRADIARAEALLEERRAKHREAGNDIYWGRVNLLGFWALRTIDDRLSQTARSTVDDVLRSTAHQWSVTRNRSPWHIAMTDDAQFPWGSNSVIATIGWHWLLWSRVSGEERFKADAFDQLHWFFGRNPLDQTYVTGPGERDAKAPHFRPWTSGAIDLPPGFLVGGPNSAGLAGDPAAGGLTGQPPMKMYVDDKESYATNEVAINWQAAWAAYTSLLAAARTP